MSRAFKINIQNKESELPVGSIWIPTNATLKQLHAALQILLDTGSYSSYIFMLVSQRRSIDQSMADIMTIDKAFAENKVIRYQNPYPGNIIFLLEETEEIDNYRKDYPIVAGMPKEKEYNKLLEKYCFYNDDWVNLWDGREGISRQEVRVKHRPRNTNVENSIENRYYKPKSFEDKRIVLQSNALLGNNEAVVISHSSSQAEFLMTNDKQSLKQYCEFAGLAVKTTWKKAECAKVFSQCLANSPWYYLLLLPEHALELYAKIINNEGMQAFKLDNSKENIEGLLLFLYLGMMDIYYVMDKNDDVILYISLAKEAVTAFETYLNQKDCYSAASKASIYLSQELPCGNRKKVMKGYDILTERIADLLRYYAVITVEELYTRLKELYQYHFDAGEFMRYLMLRMRLLEQVTTAVNITTGIRYVCLNGMDLEKVMERGDKYPQPAYREISNTKLKEFEKLMIELCKNFMEQLAYQDEDMDINYISEEIIVAIEGNAYWDEVSNLLGYLINPLELCDYGIWYCLCNLFLQMPIAALGGHSRMECAKGENPFTIINKNPVSIVKIRKKNVFAQSADIQWEFYQLCKQYIEDQNDIMAGRIKRYAKEKFGDKNMNPEDLFGLENMPWDEEDEFFENEDDFWNSQHVAQQPHVREEKKVYPNDPCPCGSGKKYKKCCGKGK